MGVSHCFSEEGLKINPSKCQLLRRSVQYLGYIVSEKGVEVDLLVSVTVPSQIFTRACDDMWDLSPIESSYLVLLR